MGDADINTLTMEWYLELTRINHALGVVKPEIRGNVNFEIKTKQLEEIHNFKQDGDETFYQAWERRVSSDSLKGIAAITNKLDSLRRDMKKLKENVHAIQVVCENYRGTHPNKEFLLNEEIKSVKEVKYGEFGRPFPNNNGNGARYRAIRRRKGMTNMAESKTTSSKLHYYKRLQVLRDSEFKFWPTYDPSSKVCNGGDRIHEPNERGNIKQWECNRDDER
nr:hypothetical protein [Tanacetum cinerariifolium]